MPGEKNNNSEQNALYSLALLVIGWIDLFAPNKLKNGN